MSLSIRSPVSRNGPFSKSKPLLSSLQAPVHVLLGFDIRRQTNGLLCLVTQLQSGTLVEQKFYFVCGPAENTGAPISLVLSQERT